MGHALFAPSAAARWFRCPGSVALTLGMEDPSSDWADEGSVAHIIANRAMVHSKPAQFFLDERVDYNGQSWIVNQEMCDAIQIYLDYVAATAKESGAVVLPEQVVQLDKTLGLAEQGGTSDAILYAAEQELVHVIDLKYGKGVRVDAQDPDFAANPQLALYALGTIESITSLLGPVKQIRVSIVQPRLDHISEFELDIDQLNQIAAHAALAVQCGLEAIGGEVEKHLHPSDYGCKWCKAKSTCPALLAKVSAEVAEEFGVIQPVEVGKSLAERYAALPLIEQYVQAVTQAAFDAVSSGQQLIGSDGQPMKLVAGNPGHRYFKNKQLAGQTLEGLIGPRAYEQPEVISPAAADKIINKGSKKKTQMWEEFLAPLIDRPRGKPVLALGSDERPAYTTAASAGEFT